MNYDDVVNKGESLQQHLAIEIGNENIDKNRKILHDYIGLLLFIMRMDGLSVIQALQQLEVSYPYKTILQITKSLDSSLKIGKKTTEFIEAALACIFNRGSKEEEENVIFND
jgi:hypothetical protein